MSVKFLLKRLISDIVTTCSDVHILKSICARVIQEALLEVEFSLTTSTEDSHNEIGLYSYNHLSDEK